MYGKLNQDLENKYLGKVWTYHSACALPFLEEENALVFSFLQP